MFHVSLTGVLLLTINTLDIFKGKEQDTRITTEETLSSHDMTDEELIRHLTDDRSAYKEYTDFILENIRMVEFSMEQLITWAALSNNHNPGHVYFELTDINEKAINTTRFHTNKVRKLKKVLPLAGEIQNTYLKALDEFEQTIDLLESNKEEPMDYSSVISRYKAGMDYVDETKNKMEELESFAYNLMVTKKSGTTTNTANNTNKKLEEEKASNLIEEIDPTHEINSNEATEVLSIFPLQVGYQYNLSHAMDGLGEAISIIGQHGNKFLAYGDQGGMVSFYRLYEVHNNEVFLRFNSL